MQKTDVRKLSPNTETPNTAPRQARTRKSKSDTRTTNFVQSSLRAERTGWSCACCICMVGLWLRLCLRVAGQSACCVLRAAVYRMQLRTAFRECAKYTSTALWRRMAAGPFSLARSTGVACSSSCSVAPDEEPGALQERMRRAISRRKHTTVTHTYILKRVPIWPGSGTRMLMFKMPVTQALKDAPWSPGDERK